MGGGFAGCRGVQTQDWGLHVKLVFPGGDRGEEGEQACFWSCLPWEKECPKGLCA